MFNLMPTMTWLQVVGLRRLSRRGPAPVRARRPDQDAPRPKPAEARAPEVSSRRRPVWVVPVAVVAVPAVVAGLVVAVARPKPASSRDGRSLRDGVRQRASPPPDTGRQTFQMHNTGDKTSEVYLIDPATGAVYGEVEGLAPGTTRDLVATVAGGSYAWRCVPTGAKAVTSATVHVSGGEGR
ncbi:hypothetical protein ACRAWF_23360 [Streptomyces sp. L7]